MKPDQLEWISKLDDERDTPPPSIPSGYRLLEESLYRVQGYYRAAGKAVSTLLKASSEQCESRWQFACYPFGIPSSLSGFYLIRVFTRRFVNLSELKINKLLHCFTCVNVSSYVLLSSFPVDLRFSSI